MLYIRCSGRDRRRMHIAAPVLAPSPAAMLGNVELGQVLPGVALGIDRVRGRRLRRPKVPVARATRSAAASRVETVAAVAPAPEDLPFAVPSPSSLLEKVSTVSER